MILPVAILVWTLLLNGASGDETALCGPGRAGLTVEDIVDGKVVAIPGCEPTPAQVFDAYKLALAKSRALNTQLQATNNEMKRYLLRVEAANRELRERLDRIERIVDPGTVRPQ